MPAVRYTGTDEVVAAFTDDPINHGDVILMTAATAGSLVGPGGGLWEYADATPEPVAVDADDVTTEEN